MAGERLYSEFTDDKGTDWRVSIYDTNVTWNEANKASFVLGSEGFVISYNGNNEQAHQPIIGSSVEFTLYQNSADHTQTLNLLYSFPEGRLLLEVYRDPDGSNTLYWRGVIMAEQVERNDEPMPTPVRITASDDIGNLKDIDFSESLGDVGAGLSVKNQIIRCLGALRTYSRWADTEVILRYVNDTELTSTEDDTDPLADIIAQTPLKISDDGASEAYSCFDILRSLATAFNARVFLSEGIWWFWPLNAHKRISDAEVLGSKVKQYDKDGDAVTFGAFDQITFNNAAEQESGTDYNKLAGHTFTHLPPVLSVQRTRRYNGNMFIVRGNDDTVVTSGTNVSLADSDRTYETGTRFRVSGFVEFQVSPDASFLFGLPASRVHVEVEIYFKVGSKYYQPEEWTTDSTDRYVIDMAGFDRSNGANINTSYSFVTDELPSEQVGLDCTAVVKFYNEDDPPSNITSAYTSEDFFIDFGVEVVDGNGSNNDLVTYRATHSSDNVLVVDQGEVLFGDNIAYSAQGKLRHLFPLVENDWKSSQTAGPLPIHRLGVNEALARQKFATKIHRGTVYGLIEMWHTMEEDSEYYLPFQLSTVMNMRETTVERYKIAFDSGSITSADDPPRADGTLRGGTLDMINSSVLTVTAQTQQPKLTAGGFPDTITSGRAIQLSNLQGPIYHRIRQIDHSSGSTTTIAADSFDFVLMNSYVDTANGFGSIYLPKVADSEGRVIKFKTDDTVHANKYIKIGPATTDLTGGVLIDGQSSFAMDRDYDGITVLCNNGQWFVIQRKGKSTGGDEFPSDHLLWEGSATTGFPYFTLSNTTTWVPWSTISTYIAVNLDTGSNVTANKEYTVPETGTYEMNFFCMIRNASAGTETFSLIAGVRTGSGGSATKKQILRTSVTLASTVVQGLGGTAVFQATAGDIITPGAYIKTDGSATYDFFYHESALHGAIRRIN
jgi:hypothetical protein